ncbi:MAG: urate hydroxylase PuuD [Proteobacteria bacterium]|nr:urate hydroxylase PuuD [Pseudomonadota bacterium]
MEAYVLDWLNLLLRWAHVITGIAWIGSSFYFVGLDNSLTPPEDPKDREKGIGGEQWAVHGGGFYHQQKYPVSPKKLPDHLHWSLWESYFTWITGMSLFTVLYLFNATTFLIDKSLFNWQPMEAVTAAIAFFIVFWVAYDTICRAFGRLKNGDMIVGALVFLLIVVASWLSCRLFAGRAAFLLVGAMMATTMSANVFFWIIPGQRKAIAQMRAGEPVDPIHGQRGKQRSVHNTFFTLPVVFAMLSNHYGFAYGAKYNWLVLVVIMLGGALIRLSFVLRHKALATHQPVPWRYAVIGVVLLAGVVFAIMPAPPAAAEAGAKPATFAQVQAIVQQRCVMCHNAALANKGVRLDNAEGISHNAQMLYQQAVVQKTMPLNNATQITDAERAQLGSWFNAGASTQ